MYVYCTVTDVSYCQINLPPIELELYYIYMKLYIYLVLLCKC